MALFAEADAQRAMSLDHVGVDFDGAAVLLQGLIETMATHEDLQAFLEFSMELFIGDFFGANWDWHPDGSITVDIKRCFAHDGITALGGIASYQCGIFERVLAWIAGLGLEFEISPAVEGCMMHREGRCRHVIRVNYGN